MPITVRCNLFYWKTYIRRRSTYQLGRYLLIEPLLTILYSTKRGSQPHFNHKHWANMLIKDKFVRGKLTLFGTTILIPGNPIGALARGALYYPNSPTFVVQTCQLIACLHYSNELTDLWSPLRNATDIYIYKYQHNIILCWF